MISTPNQIESIILDFRYFLDEALTFIEFFESGEREPARRFVTNPAEISRLRGYAIEYTRLALDLKKTLLNSIDPHSLDSTSFGEFNTGLTFSEQFKVKRLHFFTVLFSRLDELLKRLEEFENDHNENELLRIYFKLVKKIATKSNEFVGYLETSRWHREIALHVLDRLVALANDFLCVFEKFVEYLEANNRVKKSDENKLDVGTKLKREKKTQPDFKTRLLYKKLSKSKYCQWFYLLMMLILTTLAVVSLLKYFFINSNDDLNNKDVNDDQLEVVNLIDSYVNNFFDLDDEENEETKRRSTDVMVVEEEKHFYPWAQIINYMKQFQFIIFSFTTYISCEWLLNR